MAKIPTLIHLSESPKNQR